MADSLFYLSVFVLYKRLSKLIGAGGGLEATTYAFESGYCLIYSHTDEELCHALCVSRTTACELYCGYDAVLKINIYLAGANELWCI